MIPAGYPCRCLPAGVVALLLAGLPLATATTPASAEVGADRAVAAQARASARITTGAQQRPAGAVADCPAGGWRAEVEARAEVTTRATGDASTMRDHARKVAQGDCPPGRIELRARSRAGGDGEATSAVGIASPDD